jgi:L-threonylcarbamoyladenylate synthase
MEIIQVRDHHLSDADLIRCVQQLQAGNIICYPTETFYALGIDPWNGSAKEKLFELKGRPREKELPMIAADVGMVAHYCDVEDPRFALLSGEFWPGPLTFVLRSKDHSTSYAVRVSSHPVANQISAEFRRPIVSTSANPSGDAAAIEPSKLPDSFLSRIALLIDDGVCSGGLPSTIVSLLEQRGKVLREGAIPSSQLLSKI